MGFSWLNAQSLLGLVVLTGLCWLMSEDRKRFPVRLVIGAVILQAAIVLLLFAAPGSRYVLNAFTGAVDGLTAAAGQGTAFVFGYLAGGDQPYPVSDSGLLFVFAFQVLPLILVVSSISAVLWHWGVLKWVARGFGFIFERTMGLSGASAFAVALNIFLGQVETPLVIRGWLSRLTRAELFLLMTVGLATVAGSTMAAYALILKPVLPDAAGHILAASILSAPAGVAFARIMVPEKPEDVAAATALEKHPELKFDSTMDALSRGVADGLVVVLNVAAVLLVFVALVALIDLMLGPIGHLFGFELSTDRILGVVFAPLAWLTGVDAREALEGGRLLGVKLTRTEFAAFLDLGAIAPDGMSERTRMLMTYALCGFANFGSVGTTVLGLSVLVPERRAEVLSLIWKALAAGFLATLMCAAIVGALPTGLIGR